MQLFVSGSYMAHIDTNTVKKVHKHRYIHRYRQTSKQKKTISTTRNIKNTALDRKELPESPVITQYCDIL